MVPAGWRWRREPAGSISGHPAGVARARGGPGYAWGCTGAIGFAAYDGRPRASVPSEHDQPCRGRLTWSLPLIRRLAARRFTPAQLVAIDLVAVTLVIVLVEFVMTRRAPAGVRVRLGRWPAGRPTWWPRRPRWPAAGCRG